MIALEILIFKTVSTEEEPIEFCRQSGFLKRCNLCCGKQMSTRKRITGKNFGTYFRCKNYKCRKEISIK